jgi:hypothetical protein
VSGLEVFVKRDPIYPEFIYMDEARITSSAYEYSRHPASALLASTIDAILDRAASNRPAGSLTVPIIKSI